jgi:hypothetical protein
MSDIKNDTDLKPSDHILDDFLHELGATTTWDVARKFLADLREAFAREQFEETVDRLANQLGIELEEDD